MRVYLTVLLCYPIFSGQQHRGSLCEQKQSGGEPLLLLALFPDTFPASLGMLHHLQVKIKTKERRGKAGS